MAKHDNVKVEDANLSIHRQVSVDFIRNAGALAVRVNEREKTPAKGWSPKQNDKNLTEIILRDANRADYAQNLGIHLFGPLVDVDIDGDSQTLHEALERFLPPSAHIWGRDSRPRTHRVYQLKDEFDPSSHHILRVLKKIPEIKVELRGGHQSNGQYCVVPGSVHPSGENYLWSDIKRARSSLVVESISSIIRAVRLAGAVAVLVPYWVEGLRNELTMALAGFLCRTARISEALGEDVDFKMDRLTAERFMETLMEVAGDDEKDYRARYKTFEATWKKTEEDTPTTGGNTIAKITGDEAILPKLYSLLCDSPDITVLDEFTARFAIWSGPGIIIDLDSAASGTNKPFMTRQQFCNSFGHRFIESAGKKKLVADLIFHMPTTHRLAGVTFEPGKPQLVETREGRKVNQWAGFVIPPWDSPVHRADIMPFLNYLHLVLANNVEETFEWLLGWVAHIFKEPANKAGTALVLVGLPGVGKSFLGEHFLVPLIGCHAVTTSSADRAVQGFNALFDNKVYVQCDEAISSRQRIVAARLKSLITDPFIIIEPKGIDPYEKPNHMRLLFTSNETRDAVFLSDGIDDRRYTVLEVPPIMKGKILDFWMPLAQWAKNRENLSKLHRFFLDHDYDRAFISTPLKTEAKITMQEHSMPMFDRWLSSWLARGHPLSESAHHHWYDAPIGKDKEVRRDEWPRYVNYTSLVEDFIKMARQEISRTPILNEQQIKTEFRKRELEIDKHRPVRIRCREYNIKTGQHETIRTVLHAAPSEESIKEYLIRKYGQRRKMMDEDIIEYLVDDTKEEKNEY